MIRLVAVIIDLLHDGSILQSELYVPILMFWENISVHQNYRYIKLICES